MRPCSRQPSWRWATRPWPKRSRPGAGGRARRLPMPPSTPPDADGQISMSDTPSRGVIAPGATIGILGGGQLGRMTALAAVVFGLYILRDVLVPFVAEIGRASCGDKGLTYG